MSGHDKLGDIRALLLEMSDKALRVSCYDHPDLSLFYQQRLRKGMKQADVVEALIHFTETRQLSHTLQHWALRQREQETEKNESHTESIKKISETPKPSLFPPQSRWRIEMPFRPKYLFGTTNYIVVTSDDKICSYYAQTGQLKEQISQICQAALPSGYHIANGVTNAEYLFLTVHPDRLSNEENAKILAFNFKDESSPLAWHYEAKGVLLSSPTVNGNLVCFIQKGPELVILDQEGTAVSVTKLPDNYTLPRDCNSLLAVGSNFWAAIRNTHSETIINFNLASPKTLNIIQKRPDNLPLSALSTNGSHIYFSTNSYRRYRSANQVWAIDALSGQEVWTFELPPDPSGRHRAVTGAPLITDDIIYVTAHNHHIYALDLESGETIWSHEMSGRIECGPVLAGGSLVVVDRKGLMCSWDLEPHFILTVHYDLKVPPILGESNPITLTLHNRGPGNARRVIMWLSGDIEGESDNNTQEFSVLKADSFQQVSIGVKPITAGARVNLTTTIYYSDIQGQKHSQEIRCSLPVRRSHTDSLPFDEFGISEDNTILYNFITLRALLTAAMTSRDLDMLCKEKFPSIYALFKSGERLEDKQNKLISSLNQNRRVEDLLKELESRYRELYLLYTDEIRISYTSYQPRGNDFMLTPTQQAAWLVLQKAFDLVTGELKQRWQLAREKTKETDSEKTKSEVSGVSQSLQAVLKSQIEKFNDRVQLQMMMDDLETAITLTKDYNRRRNLYRQQLPNAIDAVPIQLNIEKAEEERDKAINEIKVIFEKLIQEGVIVAKNNV